jgi:phenylpropionate dioxygenase-like ring-hydroxylating dioxygenase large terminal subunit
MTIAKPVPNPIDALRANVTVPFEEAVAMPPSVYTSNDFNDAELENIFKKDWFCVGRASALSSSGDYVTCELAGQPVIVLRDRDNALRAFRTCAGIGCQLCCMGVGTQKLLSVPITPGLTI